MPNVDHGAVAKLENNYNNKYIGAYQTIYSYLIDAIIVLQNTGHEDLRVHINHSFLEHPSSNGEYLFIATSKTS